jgi:hypothetical protein
MESMASQLITSKYLKALTAIDPRLIRRFRSLSRRGSQPVDEDVLYEGVPEHLDAPLRQWLFEILTPDLFRRVCLNLHVTARDQRALVLGVDGPTLLNLVDAALHLWTPTFTEVMAVKELQLLLFDGDSAYQVAEDWSQGLERRVPEWVSGAHDQAVAAAASSTGEAAAQLLRSARAKAYGLHPDPSGAYADAVKAVEVLALPFFTPDDPCPTLGKVLGNLRQSHAKYRMRVLGKDGEPASIEAFIATGTLLWNGHSDRHAGTPRGAPIEQHQAEVAVDAAAMLVRWLASGEITRL